MGGSLSMKMWEANTHVQNHLQIHNARNGHFDIVKGYNWQVDTLCNKAGEPRFHRPPKMAKNK